MRRFWLSFLVLANFFLFFFALSPAEVVAQSFCQPCSAGSPRCDNGFTCKASICVPARGVSQENGSCFDNNDCASGLTCKGANNETWSSPSLSEVKAFCEKNNPAGQPTGKCVNTSKETPDAIFNCANRGGQCSSSEQLSSSYQCTDNKTVNECGGIGSCWIHPSQASGGTGNGSLKGSCVTRKPVTNGRCGQAGGACCDGGNPERVGNYTCEQGIPNVDRNVRDGLNFGCTCILKKMGETCSTDNQCDTGKCVNGRCGVGTKCVQISDDIFSPELSQELRLITAEDKCKAIGGTYCPTNNNGVSTGQTNFCCPNASMCVQTKIDREHPNDPRFVLCKQIPESSAQFQACEACAENNGLWTAVGCINTSYQGITGAVLKIGLSIAGGVALLLILAGAFMLTTSQGEPKRAGEAKELLTSAVVGLLFIIFSVTLLQFIGVDILRIPGFGAGRNTEIRPIRGSM